MRNVGSILPVFVLTMGVGFGQTCNQNPLKPSILPPCATIADLLSRAMDASREFKKDIGILNGEVGDARSRYWKLFPNGPGITAAETAFLSQLQYKDLYYLMFALQEGVTGRTAMLANVIGMDATTTSQDLSKFPTNVDGGIRPFAFPLFVAWVDALRRSEGRDKDGLIASPFLIAKAIQNKSNWRKAYEDARNWAEFLSSGLDISKYVTARVYLVNQMESGVSLSLARSKPEDLPDPKAASLDLYNLFVKSFGEKEVLAAATALLHTPKNSMGGLAKRAEVAIGTYQSAPSPNPFLLFLTQVTNNSPRAYATALCLDQYALLGGEATATFSTRDQWAKAASGYGQLVAKYGEPAVLAAARRLKDVAKDDQGGLRGDPKAKGTVVWFAELLKDPKIPVPDVSHFLAGSSDPRWLGKILEVRGTVSRVDVVKGFPPWATIHFKESKNDRFTAFTPNSKILNGYGEDFSGLVGKPIEVWGQVEDWREGMGIRFLGLRQLKVLDAGALVNFRESHPEWLTAAKPAEVLVDSPVYLAWKKFPPGAKVTLEARLFLERAAGTDQYTRSRIDRTTFQLQSIDADRAVVTYHSTTFHGSGGETQSSNTLTYKAKERPGTAHLQLPFPSGDVTETTTGEETLVINGNKIATKWEKIAWAKDPEAFIKTWRSDEVPGGLVLQRSQARNTVVNTRNISETIWAPVEGVVPELGILPVKRRPLTRRNRPGGIAMPDRPVP
ncbi:MAG: hypothetical protein ABSE56_15330 [Bryobacteraceae bacterium]|jgi:hypothetical protein